MKLSYKTLQESLSVDSLIENLRSCFDNFADKRAKNLSVSLTDILMSAYAIFSLKYSSFITIRDAKFRRNLTISGESTD